MFIITSVKTRLPTLAVRFPIETSTVAEVQRYNTCDQSPVTQYFWANVTTPADKGKGRATDDIPHFEPSTPSEMSE